MEAFGLLADIWCMANTGRATSVPRFRTSKQPPLSFAHKNLLSLIMPVCLMFKIFGMFDTHTKGSVNLVVVLLHLNLALPHLNLVGLTLLLLPLLRLQVLQNLLPSRTSLPVCYLK